MIHHQDIIDAAMAEGEDRSEAKWQAKMAEAEAKIFELGVKLEKNKKQ
jgi:hypothetical protein